MHCFGHSLSLKICSVVKLVSVSERDILLRLCRTNSEKTEISVTLELQLNYRVKILLVRMKLKIVAVIISHSLPGRICCGFIYNKINPFLIL